MIIIRRQTAIFATMALYTSLVTHDSNLYPNLTFGPLLALSALRLILLIIPLGCGWYITRAVRNNYLRLVVFLIWLLFITYTVYSATEIRHVAELCRLSPGLSYTTQCVQQSWTLLPIFIYALAGTLIFVFSLAQVSATLFRRSAVKRIFILTMCVYGAIASMFGLYTRINVWNAAIHPWEFIQKMISTFYLPGFVFNTFVLAVFFVGIVFVTNRIIRHAGRYIP